ncbi:MAG: MFS transporter [Gammaproteobacteria bacterium]|nr:MFS transporter [Gammaproteobacteria bacterium]
MVNDRSSLPYWRLSTFYLFYFASLGALLPYWGLYLRSLGYGAGEIGELMAVMMVTKIVSPNIWGWIADHSGKSMTVIRWGSLLSLCSFLAVFRVEGFLSLAVVIFLFSFFWNATLPQFEAVTLGYLRQELHRYSWIRVWGSIGFIIAVLAIAPVVETHGIALLPWLLALLYGAIYLSSLLVHEPGVQPHPHASLSLLQVLRQREVLLLLGVAFLMQASHGAYYSFYSLYLEQYGYSSVVIGQLWALGVVVEVAIFMVMSPLISRFGLRSLLQWSLALTALRWLFTATFPQWLGVMVATQSLHAASFGIFHAVAISLFHQAFPGRLQGRGQALYSSISFGAGGAIGALVSGYVWELSSPRDIFLVAAALSTLALLVSLQERGVEDEK